MVKDHLGKEYFCPVCKLYFVMQEDLLDEVVLEHDCGEHMTLTTAQCPNCESMLIPEGMNQITWLIPFVKPIYNTKGVM